MVALPAYALRQFLFRILDKFHPFIKADEISGCCDVAKFDVQFVFFDLAHLVLLCVVVCHTGIVLYISTQRKACP